MIINFAPTAARHKPVFTIILIVVNVMATILVTANGLDSIFGWRLSFGDGLHPWQWLVSPFLHTDMALLVGNLVFLFLFATYIETRIGTGLFVILFFALSISSSALEQMVMLGQPRSRVAMQVHGAEVRSVSNAADSQSSSGRSVNDSAGEGTAAPDSRAPLLFESIGSSTTIFGLVAAFIVMGATSRLRLGESENAVEIPMLVFAGLFLAWESSKWYVTGVEMDGLPLRLLGVIPGLALGGSIRAMRLDEVEVALEHSETIEAEGLDSIASALMSVTETKSRGSRAERRSKERQKRLEIKQAARAKAEILRQSAMLPTPVMPSIPPSDPVIEKAMRAMSSDRPEVAILALKSVNSESSLSQFPIDFYLALYHALSMHNQWRSCAMVLEKSLVGHPDDAIERRLELGRILVAMGDQERAVSVLAKVPRESLADKHRSAYRELAVKIHQSKSAS